MNNITTEEIIKNSNAKFVKGVSEIKLQQKELSVIPNLKDFSNLKILDVSSNRIKNLQFCSSNLNLVTLLVYDNEIVDLTGLCQLKNLSVLHAQYNAIKNIDTCFYNLAHLTDLRLDDNEIEKVGVNALRQCTVLTNLDLSYNSIENVEFLADLPNLAYLTMTHNRLKSIKPLTRCPKLNELDVSDNSISEHGLGEDGFLELERLNLSNNEVTKISGDIQIRGTLTALILSGNQLAELPEMGNYFPNLDILEISENKFQHLDDILNSICGCENLRELSIKGNPFECEDDTVSVLARTIKKRMPNVSCLNGVSLEMVSEKVMPSGSDRTRVRQKDIYEMIESQLSHLSTLTTPLEESFEKSFNALQEVLGRLEVQECTEQSNDDEQATPEDFQAKQEEMHGFPVSSDQGDVESEGNQM